MKKTLRQTDQARSAGFQPAVSPISNRQSVRRFLAPVDWPDRQRVGNPRNGRLEICATWRAGLRNSFQPRGGTNLLGRLGAVLLLWLACGAVQAQNTNAPAGQDLSAFRIISERNIFNQNRSTRPPPVSRSTSRERESRPVRSETITLLGTMSYEKGHFAFFDGSSSDHRKKVQPEDTIAGYRIAEIGFNYVKLESSGREIELRHGMQLRRQEGRGWEVVGRRDSTEIQTPVSTSSEDSGGSTASDGEESEILKRLRQQREQELNK